jgi:hypothetical protein
MSRTRWLFVGCLTLFAVAIAASLAVIYRTDAPGAGSPTPSPPPPQPTPGPDATPGPDPDAPWVEQVSFPPAQRLVAAQFRYRGRYLDCWAVCEAGAYREVVPLHQTELESQLLREGRSGGPPEGLITVGLALPADAAIRHCVFTLNLTAGGSGFGWFRVVPCPPWWGRQGGTGNLGPDRVTPAPGRTVRLFEHLAENPPDFHNPLVRMHHDHLAALKARGQWGTTSEQWDATRDREGVGTPAAWTAAWMLALAADGRTGGLAAVIPYRHFLETYYAFVRVRVYARFRTDDEVRRVRERAAELRKEKRGSWGSDLVPLVESFRRPPER